MKDFYLFSVILLPRTQLTSLDTVAAAQPSHVWKHGSEGKREIDGGKVKQGGRQQSRRSSDCRGNHPSGHLNVWNHLKQRCVKAAFCPYPVSISILFLFISELFSTLLCQIHTSSHVLLMCLPMKRVINCFQPISLLIDVRGHKTCRVCRSPVCVHGNSASVRPAPPG